MFKRFVKNKPSWLNNLSTDAENGSVTLPSNLSPDQTSELMP